MLPRARLQAEGVRHARGLRSLSAALLKYAFWWCALLLWQGCDSTRCIPFRAIHQIVARRCDLAGRAPVLAGAAHGTVSAPELRAPSAQHLAPCLMRSTGSERTRRRPCTWQHRACTLQRSAPVQSICNTTERACWCASETWRSIGGVGCCCVSALRAVMTPRRELCRTRPAPAPACR